MWTRSELKARAKATLKVSYWQAFVVSLVLGVATGGGSSSGSSSVNNYSDQILYDNPYALEIAMIVLVVILIIILVSIALGFFVLGPLEIGCRRYFTSATCYDFNMANIGFGFKKQWYFNVALAQLLRSVYILLWSLLLIVPGIIKGYSYSMAPYILADNPNLSPSRAITLSRQMMDGNKADLWVLHLSFLGWYLLGTLACFVGILFVNPYAYSTEAEFYMIIRHQAIEKGITSRAELCLE